MRVRLMKPVYTRYRDEQGRPVPKGTPGAVKVQEEAEKWYAEWYEGRNKKKRPLATDKGVAQKMLGDLVVDLEKGLAGMTDPYQKHRKTPLLDHVTAYLKTLQQAVKDAAMSEKHYAERKRLLKTVLVGLKGAAAKTDEERDKVLKGMTLADITDVALSRFLKDLGTSPRTRDTYRGAVNTFCNWLASVEGERRLEHNPLRGVPVQKGKKVRKRRALSPEQLQLVLNAARTRPLEEVMTIRHGPRKGQLTANVGDKVKDRMLLLGRERGLLYKTAILTALRRKELRQLRVRHLHLDAQPSPYLDLPGQYTKNGEPAKLLLVPALAMELKEWIADMGKQEDDVVFVVPPEVVKVYKRDLKAAGIPYKDGEGRVADFHALRKTTNTMLGLAGVRGRVRQLFMRHKNIHLTLETYDDATMYELDTAVKALEKVNLQ
jgi:integrase